MRYRIVDEDDIDTPLEENEVVPEDKYTPRAPDIGMDDDEVESTEFEYSTRAPGDYVVSGPLGDGGGPGHRFQTVTAALIWLTRKVGGKRIKQRIRESEAGGRWSFLVAAKKDGE